MLSVARVAYKPLKALAVNVIAVYSRSRRKRRKPDSMTTAEPARLYSQEELLELRRNVLRYARTFPPGDERNQHLHVAVSLRALFKDEKWLRDHVRNDS